MFTSDSNMTGAAIHVGQDEAPTVTSDGERLWTNNLMNCLGLAICRQTTIGLLHVSPNHKNSVKWIRELVDGVTGSTQGTVDVLIAGAAASHAKGAFDTLAGLLSDFSSCQIINQASRRAKLPSSLGGSTSSQSSMMGFLQVQALSSGPVFHQALLCPDSVALASARKSSNKTCIIL